MVHAITAKACIRVKAIAVNTPVSAVVMRNVPSAATWTAKVAPMTDDIVTRLRDYLAIVDHAFVWNELSDAADEIERLRALVHGYRMCAFELYSGIHGDSQFSKAGESVKISATTEKAMQKWLQYDYEHWEEDVLHER